MERDVIAQGYIIEGQQEDDQGFWSSFIEFAVYLDTHCHIEHYLDVDSESEAR